MHQAEGGEETTRCGIPLRLHRKQRHSPERGWTQLLLLRILHEVPMHGYQLMEEFVSRGYVKPEKIEPGAIYTLLRRMERREYLTSIWQEQATGPDRRIYTLTPEGNRVLLAGLEAMIRRKPVIDDLATYYERHSKTLEASLIKEK